MQSGNATYRRKALSVENRTANITYYITIVLPDFDNTQIDFTN